MAVLSAVSMFSVVILGVVYDQVLLVIVGVLALAFIAVFHEE